MNITEARSKWQAQRAELEASGLILPDVVAFLPPEFKRDFQMAMDAQPALTTTLTNGVPAFLSLMMDPEVIRVRFAPNKAAEIFGEQKRGTWVDDTIMFNVVEHTGEVSSYGDFNENGNAGVNQQFPQRQQYLYQTIKEVGDRDIARAGLTKLNLVSEKDMAAATVMQKFENFTYFFGVAGLQNYGLLNDPGLSAALTPAPKTAGGNAWFNGSGQLVATPNEVYNDIVALFSQIVKQTAGLVDKETPMTLALSPASDVGLTATNNFNVNVSDILKKSFPNIKVKSAVQYGAKTTDNPQGNAAGNLAQLIVDAVDGQKTGFSAFSEKMRAHPIVRSLSSFKQKLTGGSWGSVVRMPMGIAQMVGI